MFISILLQFVQSGRVSPSPHDLFFDALSKAVLFDRFGQVLPDADFRIEHVYLCFQYRSKDAERVLLAQKLGYDYFLRNKSEVEEQVHDHLDEFVYRRKIVAPNGYSASISIMHTFYGIFDVVTFVSNVRTINAINRVPTG